MVYLKCIAPDVLFKGKDSSETSALASTMQLSLSLSLSFSLTHPSLLLKYIHMNSHTHVHVFSFHLQIIELLVAVLRTRFVFCHIGTYLVSFIRNEFTHGQLVVSHGKCEMRFTLKQNLLLIHLLITFPVIPTTYLNASTKSMFSIAS